MIDDIEQARFIKRHCEDQEFRARHNAWEAMLIGTCALICASVALAIGCAL